MLGCPPRPAESMQRRMLIEDREKPCGMKNARRVQRALMNTCLWPGWLASGGSNGTWGCQEGSLREQFINSSSWRVAMGGETAMHQVAESELVAKRIVDNVSLHAIAACLLPFHAQRASVCSRAPLGLPLRDLPLIAGACSSEPTS